MSNNTTLDFYNILEYYGDINLNILEEVIHVFPNTTGIQYGDKTYGITTEELRKLSYAWNREINA